MSGRGAGSAAKKMEFELVPTPELGRRVLTTAQELLRLGMTSAEVCSLFTHAAAVLAAQEDGLEEGEWLALCQQLQAQDELEQELAGAGAVLTAPGGSA